jgi:hypothetical protein
MESFSFKQKVKKKDLVGVSVDFQRSLAFSNSSQISQINSNFFIFKTGTGLQAFNIQ